MNDTLNYQIADYKSRLKTLLVNDENIIRIISPELVGDFDIDTILTGGEFLVDGERVLLQGYVLDFYFIPDTTLEDKLFICFEIETPRIEKGFLADFTLNVFVFTLKTNVILSEFTDPKKSDMLKLGFIGNRIDICCDIIEEKFKGLTEFGLGQILPTTTNFITTTAPTNNYYGKRMSFNVKSYSPRKRGDDCGN